MKRYLILLTIFLSGCAATPQAVQNTNTGAAPATDDRERVQAVTAHSSENQTPRPADANATQPSSGTKWSRGGRAIDTSKFDAAIAEAEKGLKAKPASEEAKAALGRAYFDRATALTEAQQYASALGDYRKAHKYGHPEAQKWIDQIVSIYDMLKKDYPKEGEEPPPLPFEKS
jgi:tetratricopeptide (TPR) repeat protein